MRIRRDGPAPIAWLSLALLLLLALTPAPAGALDTWAPTLSDDTDGFSLDDTPAGTPLVAAWQAPPPSFAPLPDDTRPSPARPSPRSAPSRGPPLA